MKRPPFQTLVDAHWRDVARLAHALAGPAHGDDVAQQAWLQALAAYPRVEPRNLRSWLLQITRNCAMDSHRQRSRLGVHESPTEIDGARPVTGTTLIEHPPEPLDAGLWAAVAALPDRQREAVVLKYVADCDHHEIARVLSTTPAMSRRLVSDALATLRRQTAKVPS